MALDLSPTHLTYLKPPVVCAAVSKAVVGALWGVFIGDVEIAERVVGARCDQTGIVSTP